MKNYQISNKIIFALSLSILIGGLLATNAQALPPNPTVKRAIEYHFLLNLPTLNKSESTLAKERENEPDEQFDNELRQIVKGIEKDIGSLFSYDTRIPVSKTRLFYYDSRERILQNKAVIIRATNIALNIKHRTADYADFNRELMVFPDCSRKKGEIDYFIDLLKSNFNLTQYGITPS